eukprot:3108767-Amphidinium_carterae.1
MDEPLLAPDFQVLEETGTLITLDQSTKRQGHSKFKVQGVPEQSQVPAGMCLVNGHYQVVTPDISVRHAFSASKQS